MERRNKQFVLQVESHRNYSNANTMKAKWKGDQAKAEESINLESSQKGFTNRLKIPIILENTNCLENIFNCFQGELG